jgi:hypothetical protein
MCIYFHKGGHTFKSFISFLCKTKDIARYIVGIKEILNENAYSSHSENLLMYFVYQSSSILQEWIVDYGATQYMTKHEQLLCGYRQLHISNKVVISALQPYTFQAMVMSP